MSPEHNFPGLMNDLLHTEPLTTMHVEDLTCCGAGTLYIYKNDMSWVNDAGISVRIPYETISVTGRASPDEKFPFGAIFMLLEDRDDCFNEFSDVQLPKMIQVKFVTETEDNLEIIYENIRARIGMLPDPQLLNGPQSDESENDGNDELGTSEEEVEGQFEDAD